MVRIRTKRNIINQIKETSKKPVEKSPSVEFISTGCLPLNLALSQKGKDGGIARGRICNIVGDGSSGKTLLALEICAWAYYNIEKTRSKIFPKVKKVLIVYNNSEGVMDFPISKMYGTEFEKAVEWTFIETCEGMGRDIQRRIKNLKNGEFLLYVQDSIDSLISEVAQKRLEKSIKNDQPEDGSYGTEKAKYFSQSFFNHLCGIQQGKDTTIILISQVRENLNAGIFGKKYYRTGGKALDFYTHQVSWLYQKEKLQKERKGKKRVYGVRVLAKIERNKTALPFREAEFIIRFDYGIDNYQSMIDFLFGPKEKSVYLRGNEIQYKFKEELISDMEENEEIFEIVQDEVIEEWIEIEEAIKTKRKRKY